VAEVGWALGGGKGTAVFSYSFAHDNIGVVGGQGDHLLFLQVHRRVAGAVGLRLIFDLESLGTGEVLFEF